MIKHVLHIIWWKITSNQSRIKYLKKQGVKIGENCSISSDVKFGTEPFLISIGDNVRLTSNVQFITHDGSLWVLRNLKMIKENADIFGKIKIGNNVNIGWNCVILPGVSIGNNCIIGANSVITHSIPDNSVAVGNPARVIKTINEYYDNIEDKIVLTKGLQKEERKKIILKSNYLKK